MTKLDKAYAMKCFGKLVVKVELDPKTQDELTGEYNCKNCDSLKYCATLALTLA